jgi:hypothetical protein
MVLLDDIKRLSQRHDCYCGEADAAYAMKTARALGDDPFKIGSAMANLMVSPVRRARVEGLRAWLIAEFMDRRGLKHTQAEKAAYKDVFGTKLEWEIGCGKWGRFDHTFWFRDGNGYLIATHPYNAEHEDWFAFGARTGARIEFPEDFPSWWFPGVTRLIVCTREVKAAE